MAKLAQGITFEVSTDGGTVFSTIPGVLTFNKGAITSEEIDATDSDSTGAFREFINGFKAASEGTMTLHRTIGDAVHNSIRTALSTGAVLDFRVTNGAEQLDFAALVKGYDEPITIGEKEIDTVTLKMTGEPTYT